MLKALAQAGLRLRGLQASSTAPSAQFAGGVLSWALSEKFAH
jgi:hypothetical protein